MNKNENFKDVINNLKNLSGGTGQEGKIPIVEEGEIPIVEEVTAVAEENEIKDSSKRQNLFTVIPFFFAIFNFLNALLYGLVRDNTNTNDTKKNQIGTWTNMTTAHSMCFLVVALTFGIYLGIPNLYCNLESKIPKTDYIVNNWHVMMVFMIFVILLLMSFLIIACEEKVRCTKKNKYYEDEEEEQLQQVQYESKCFYKGFSSKHYKDYQNMIIGLFSTQLIMSILFLALGRSTDEFFNDLNSDIIKIPTIGNKIFDNLEINNYTTRLNADKELKKKLLGNDNTNFEVDNFKVDDFYYYSLQVTVNEQENILMRHKTFSNLSFLLTKASIGDENFKLKGFNVNQDSNDSNDLIMDGDTLAQEKIFANSKNNNQLIFRYTKKNQADQKNNDNKYSKFFVNTCFTFDPDPDNGEVINIRHKYETDDNKKFNHLRFYKFRKTKTTPTNCKKNFTEIKTTDNANN